MHRTLARQLRRTLGLEHESQVAAVLALAAELAAQGRLATELAAALAGLGGLLARVGATYEQYDRDLELRTRSLDLSSEELLETNRKLQHQLAIQRGAEKALHLSASVFRSVQEGISITDAGNRIVEVNEAYVRITGYGKADLLGRDPSLLSAGHQGREFYQAMWQAVLDQGYWQGEVWNRRPDGQPYAARLTISVVRDEGGRISHYIGALADITTEKQQQEELERIAHYDALTGVPNRVLLADRLGQALAQTRRNGNRLAVCYLDLDNFKPINDTCGHEAGDRLLVEIAGRLRLCLRGGDTVARLGGDEFVLLLALDSHAECESALQRVLQTVAQPLALCGKLLSISASVGVSLFPEEDADPDTLLRQADQAMYAAKQRGGNRCCFFDSESNRRIRQQRETIERVRDGIARREFVLHYQPRVDMRHSVIEGVEALIRWQHPSRGLLQPAEFLPAIEDTEVIVALGDWVIGEALRQAQVWHGAGFPIAVSVNVAARQLQQRDFAERLAAHLAAHAALPKGVLRLEILETTALDDVAEVSRIIDACHALGVGIELDDFGTGYSSLTYLRRLPADALKIDQSFVRDMLEDRADLAIVEGVIGLATAFRMGVIAEGVETVEHGIALLNLGCHLAQGYGIARPMPAAAVPAWVAEHRLHRVDAS